MIQFVCPKCGAKYPDSEPIWKCRCGSFLDLDFHPTLHIASLPKDQTMWRYKEVLPIENEANFVSYNEGYTPLIDLNVWGIPILGKLDFLLPSGSFKDRGAAMMVSKCKEWGIKEIVEDSSGNSACAVAAYAAKAGIKANIYMPASNSVGKTVQVRAYGSTLHLIPGNRIDCANAAIEGAAHSYYAAHAWNPYFLQGTKTAIYEIVEQLGWQAPDYMFMPVASGSQFLGIYLGLQEMLAAGIISKMPRLMPVQSENCCPIKNAIEHRETPITATNPTIAEGIAIFKPTRLNQIVEAMQATGGSPITVSEEEIVASLKEIALKGVYIEPTSATAVAAVKKCKDLFAPGDKIVVSFTGSGLKASAKISSLLE